MTTSRILKISLCIATASEVVAPIAGFVIAALLFPGGIHGYHPEAFIAVTVVANFAVIFGLSYGFLALWDWNRRLRNMRRHTGAKALSLK
jgi:hypothetical protein